MSVTETRWVNCADSKDSVAMCMVQQYRGIAEYAGSHSRLHQLFINVDRLIYIDRSSAMIGGAARVLSWHESAEAPRSTETRLFYTAYQRFGISEYYVLPPSSCARAISMHSC